MSGDRKPRRVVPTLLLIYCHTLEREEVRKKELTEKSPACADAGNSAPQGENKSWEG